MEIIICKAFVVQFYSYYKAEEVFWEDFERFLRKYIAPNTTLITDIPENEWLEIGLSYQWFIQLQGRLRKTIVISDVMNEITKNEYYEKSSPFQLFCTDKDFWDCKKMAKEFGFLYLNLTHLPEFWKVFYSEREDNFSLKVTNDISENRRFDTWEKLQAFSHPISHVVVFDKYILSDTQKLAYNLFPLLENLFGNLALKRQMYLTFIVEEKDKLVEKQQIIAAFLAKKWQNIRFDVSVFCYASDVHIPNFEGLHDRGIYTNYFRISSGDSFNYFKNRRNDINNTTEIRFDFVFGKNNSFILKDLRDIKTYILKTGENDKRFVGNTDNPLLS